MKSKISRRKFIAGSLIAGVSFYVGGWWLFKVRKGDATDIIKSILKKRLDYLKLDEKGIHSFALDFQKYLSDKVTYWGSWAGMFVPIYSVMDIFKLSPKSQRFRDFESEIVSQYLLSSDFFWNNADMDRTIKYVSYYDPFETGCSNPFAQF